MGGYSPTRQTQVTPRFHPNFIPGGGGARGRGQSVPVLDVRLVAARTLRHRAEGVHVDPVVDAYAPWLREASGEGLSGHVPVRSAQWTPNLTPDVTGSDSWSVRSSRWYGWNRYRSEGNALTEAGAPAWDAWADDGVQRDPEELTILHSSQLTVVVRAMRRRMGCRGRCAGV